MRETHLEVDEQGKKAVNFQLSVTIYALVAAFTGAGLALGPLLVALIVFDLGQVALASYRVAQGDPNYRYRLALPLLR